MAVQNRCWCEDPRKRITTTTVALEECKLQRPFKAAQDVESSNRKIGRVGNFGLSQEPMGWRWGVCLERASVSHTFCH